jgi:5-hydroxyisourate hydrolase
VNKISTHVLDTSLGKPAHGVTVRFFDHVDGEWRIRAEGETDPDGRCGQLYAETSISAGTYRLCFETGPYFAANGVKALYPEVVVTFEVEEGQSYHIPLLLSPFGYSTYRGS